MLVEYFLYTSISFLLAYFKRPTFMFFRAVQRPVVKVACKNLFFESVTTINLVPKETNALLYECEEEELL